MGKLDDKVAIVTGSGQGNGRGVALAFAKEGAKIVVAELIEQRAQAVQAELAALGADALAIACDVSQVEDGDLTVEKTLQEFGSIDILVNNAQAGDGPKPTHPRTGIEDLTNEYWDLSFDSGARGTWLFCKAAFPHLKLHGGKIINFGSIGGMRGTEFAAAYNAAKEAIRAFTRTAAREWGRHGITVNCICPISATPALLGFLGREDADNVQAYMKTLPLSRLGDPEKDIGRTAVFLASEDADFITGQTINVDGGAWMF